MMNFVSCGKELTREFDELKDVRGEPECRQRFHGVATKQSCNSSDALSLSMTAGQWALSIATLDNCDVQAVRG